VWVSLISIDFFMTPLKVGVLSQSFRAKESRWEAH
jgi:hypothetical protein